MDSLKVTSAISSFISLLATIGFLFDEKSKIDKPNNTGLQKTPFIYGDHKSVRSQDLYPYLNGACILVALETLASMIFFWQTDLQLKKIDHAEDSGNKIPLITDFGFQTMRLNIILFDYISEILILMISFLLSFPQHQHHLIVQIDP